MKVAIIGLAQSGKTTLFRALTGTGTGREKGSLNIGTVKVPDGRVDRLAAIYKPAKTTHAVLEIVEANAPAARADRRPGQDPALDSAFLNLVKPMDAFLLVLRAFDEEGLNEPATDAESLIGEMILADLMTVEGKLERLALDAKKGRPVLLEEKAALEAAAALLNAGKLVHADPAVASLPALRSYALMTGRPILLVVNVGEADTGADPASVLAKFGLPVHGLQGFVCNAKFEQEIQDLPEADRPDFMEALGIREPVLDVVVREVYSALGLISFLTGGEDEVRAWTIRRGTLAPKAAGVVHSDMEKGFIRAEVIAYEDFLRLGSEAAARKAGRYRLEGREYVVQDGDIINFRFNV